MTDSKFTGLPAASAIDDTDLLALSQDVATTPISKSSTILQLRSAIIGSPSYFNVVRNADVANVTGDSTYYSVVFNGVNYNIGSNYNSTTGIYTAPKDGLYLFCYHVTIYGVTSNNTFGHMRLSTTNKDYDSNLENPWLTKDLNDELGRGAAVLAKLDAGDTAQVYIFYGNSSKVIGLRGDVTQTWFNGGLYIGG
jgi:hypothetical protein